SSTQSIQDASGRFVSGLSGFTRTQSRPGERMNLTLRVHALQQRKRAALRALIASLRGGVNRVWCKDHSYSREGSIAAPELVNSQTFENGTTGYTMGTDFSGSVTDRILRATRGAADGTTSGIVRLSSAATVTAFQPYVFRVLVTPGRGNASGFALRAGSSAFSSEYGAITGFEDGLLSLAFVPYSTSAHCGLLQDSLGCLAGDFVEIPFISLALCALVDNGANYLKYSSDITKAFTSTSPQVAVWTPTRASITTTSVTLPDGTAGTANSLHEDNTAANNHFVDQNVTVPSTTGLDICFAVALHSANRTWARVAMVEQT